MAAHARRGRFRVLKSGAGLLGVVVLVGAVVLSPPPSGVASGTTTLIDDTFANAASSSAVTYASNGTGTSGETLPCLTAGGSGTSTIPNCDLSSPDKDGSGALMLTDAGFGEASNVMYSQSFPTADGLDITFDTEMYGGVEYGGAYADGISFDLATAPPNPGAVGQAGGALGYSTNGTNPGIPGGYLGIGLDEYGNYTTTTYEGSNCHTS